MDKLRILDLSYNHLNSTLPTPSLTTLRELNLYDNSFTGSIPEAMMTITGMQSLNVSVNLLTGVIPGSIGLLVNLRKLDVSENQINGTVPRALFQLPRLDYLSLNNNQLTGRLNAEVYQMNRLSDLDLSHNQLSGGLPGVNVSTRDLPPLRHLYLSDNLFTSTIPSIFASMDALVILDLSSNLLGGTIPTALFNNSNSPLKFVYLQTNHLRGRIPELIGNSLDLQHLFLFENELTGSLPDSMLQLNQLQTLLLQDNELSGQPGRVITSSSTLQPAPSSAPASAPIIMMQELQILDLSNNLFTGNVPTEIFELPKIRYVSITEGCFDGSIPQSVCGAQSMTHVRQTYLTYLLPHLYTHILYTHIICSLSSCPA
jgi:Leucine-rich repeat (LRR) protein